jgi:hypothetical protein
MHLGLLNGLFVPPINSRESRSLAKVPDGSQTYNLNILWMQKEEAQIHLYE